ncbi:MAG: response regulator [Gemmatimonadaceae bacterium]
MPRRILVVDDDRAMVATLCDILELRGWETVRAYDGAAAAELAEVHGVDVVLMDVRMPKVDGVSALREIKARRPGVRVVLMTAYAAQELLARAEAEGALRILRKPVELSELFGLLDEAATDARTVLVIDDDPAYLTTLADVLADHGLVPTKARSLPQALALLEQNAHGAVILDLKLPGVESSSAIVAIRRVSPSVLLVLYSGHSTELAQTAHGPAEGLIDAAFMKPIPIAQLLDVLDGHGPR